MNQNRKPTPLKDEGFYHSGPWRRIRKLRLQRDHYLCQLRISPECTRRATTVHHVLPLEDYPELALDIDNLTSCCFACHELTKQRSSEPNAPAGVRIIKI